ncbi:PEP4 [Symbiodinium pilosum]|uniref:PEP4 protein n=1 Tax=Symbiodinium pilosum TaxID=2952 RepID=A0A812XQU5_SYMPI|nr:PEP4 [Symbiodinium pilosum]
MNIDYPRDVCITDEFREALAQVVCKATAEQPSEPFHYMIWGRNAEGARQPKGSEHLATLKEFAAKLAVTLTPGMDVISIRVLFSPPGSPAQPFHLDYAQHFSEVRTIFISASPSTASNCTEWLDFGETNSEIVARARQLVQKGITLELSDLSPHKPAVQSLVLDAGQVCVLRTSHVFHRRGPNRSEFTRITFNVDVAHLPESPEFVDLDTCRSLGQKRICGLDVVDALDEQDICLHGFPD